MQLHVRAQASAALLVIALSGCATMGNPVYQQEFDKVVVGKSTITEVRRYWGHPSDLLVSSNGNAEMTWEWTESQVKATSFIPFAAYVGGAGTTGTTTKIVGRFSPDGVLREVLRGGSTVDITSGTVTQGYKTVGEVKAQPGTLEPMPSIRPGTGQKCSDDSPCPGSMVCSKVADKDYGFCVGGIPK